MENGNFRLFAANGNQTANFSFFAANRNGKQKFVFLGRQTIDGNQQ
jgi:hypothetical protein